MTNSLSSAWLSWPSASATLLHEGVGHGLTAWLRGDIPTELTSNHFSSLRSDRWVDAGGTLVNLFVGASSLLASRVAGDRANMRYFFWIFAGLNLLHGAGYFLFSGISGFGDWNEVIRGLPYQVGLRIGMTVFGIVLYFFAVWRLAASVGPFLPDRRTYNVVGRLPYCGAALFSCAAGALDPLGIKLLLVSTVPAAFGGPSGLLWADSLLPRTREGRTLLVRRQIAWWFVASIVGGLYIAFIGRGIQFPVFSPDGLKCGPFPPEHRHLGIALWGFTPGMHRVVANNPHYRRSCPPVPAAGAAKSCS